jgi:hypoxanthine-DNA glycosylase
MRYNKNMEKIFHPLEPIFDKNSRVLILGTMPSPASRKIGMYYGHPQNRFWRVLAAVFDEKIPVSNDERRGFLLAHKIACWDVLASCDINGASDASIKSAVPNDFSPIFDTADIRRVFTTGKTAAFYYEKFTGKRPCVLPSPSPANCAVSFERLTEAYSAIKPFL